MRLFYGILITAVFTVLGQILNIVQETLVAAKFGTSYLTDAYLVAFTIPYMRGSEMFNGILKPVFVPLYVDARLKSGEDSAKRFARTILYITIMFIRFTQVASIFRNRKIF